MMCWLRIRRWLVRWLWVPTALTGVVDALIHRRALEALPWFALAAVYFFARPGGLP